MKKLLTSLTSIVLLGSTGFAQEKNRGTDLKKVDWDQIKERIEGAVKRGDITRDQANAKYAEIKKKHGAHGHRDHPRDREHDHEHDKMPREARMKQLLGRLVESKQISPETAHQIFRTAFEGREEHHEHHKEQEHHEHLEHLAGKLEHLIDRAHRELKEIEKARHELSRGQERDRAQIVAEERARQTRKLAEAKMRENMERIRREQQKKLEAPYREAIERKLLAERKKLAELRERETRERAIEKKDRGGHDKTERKDNHRQEENKERR